MFGTVTTNVAEVKVTTSDRQRRTVRTFQDLRPEFGDVVGWFVILPQPTNNLSTINATIQYLDANGNEVAGASFMSLVGS